MPHFCSFIVTAPVGAAVGSAVGSAVGVDVSWLRENNFTQSDINDLGRDAAATDKLYECYLLNCDLTAENPGGALSITDFAVSTNKVSVTVQLVRQSPLGSIGGVLCLFGADNLAAGFGNSPISEGIVGFVDGDSTFDTVDTGSVTQSVTATFSTADVTKKFFKAKIESQRPEGQEE